jgi:VCBS repeat-containing protein
MATTKVNTTAGLLSALQLAHAGDTILLASGTYGDISINNYNKNGVVTISSQNPLHPAVLTGLAIDNSAGLTFSNVSFSTVASTAWYPFAVYASSSINFSNIYAYGSGPSGTPSGLIIENSTNVAVTGSHFEQLLNGIVGLNNTNVTYTGNSFDLLGQDGIQNAGSSNVLVSGNSFTSFETVPGMHPEAILFFTSNTTESAQNIVVTGNSVTQGTGTQIQGVFVQDEVGTLPFINMTISNNTILGGMWNGICVQGADNLTVSGNILTSYVDPTVTNPDLSWIRLENVSGASVTNNIAAQYLYTSDTGMVQSGNQTSAYVTATTGALTATAPVEAVLERQSAAGAINLHDDSSGNPVVASVYGQAVTAAGSTFVGNYGYGQLTIHSNGTFSYAATAEGLTVGQVYTDTVTAVITDAHGAVTSTVLEFTITGSATGNGGADNIVGGSGAETISGFGASSQLTSGTGPDSFVFSSLAQSTPTAFDAVVGFKAGDLIDLTAVDPSFQIVSAFDHHAHELVIQNDGGGAWDIYGDTTGSGTANFQIHLTGATTAPSALDIHL